MTGRSLIAGLDVGGTKTLAVVGDARRPPMAWHRQRTVAGDRDALLATMIEALNDAAHRAEIEPSELAAIGIGLPGVVDPATGEVRHAVNLGIGGRRSRWPNPSSNGSACL